MIDGCLFLNGFFSTKHKAGPESILWTLSLDPHQPTQCCSARRSSARPTPRDCLAHFLSSWKSRESAQKPHRKQGDSNLKISL